MIKVLFVTICLLLFQHQGNSMKKLPGVKHYEVVYPQKIHSMQKRNVEGSQNSHQKANYEDDVQYEIKLNGIKAVLHLEKNKDLFPEDYTETHYSSDGRQITTIPKIKDHCYYGGHILNDYGSTASISTCDGLRGYLKFRGKRYLIEPLKVSDSEAHAVYKYESIENTESPKVCGVTNTTWESEDPLKKTARISTSMEKEAYLKAKKYVELYIAVDHRVFRHFSRNLITIKTRVFEIVNYINTVYKPLKVHVALIGLEIWSDGDKIVVDASSGITLDRFADWRRSVLLKQKRNDNAQLLTGIDLEGPTVGLAFVGTMCSDVHSAGIVQDHNTNPIPIGATMAHEMGHNFGMNHDTTFCTCNSGSCIMEAQLSSHQTPWEFSSCSLNDFQNYIMDQMPECITNMPSTTDIIATPVCGNDFVEEGEECDCGTPEECSNSCCDATTCKLQPDAECGFGECCQNCKIRRAGAVCRAAKHDCDLPELCSGVSYQCPEDRFRVNGFPCKNKKGYCYMGKCPILQDQCISLWGAGATVAADSCFNINQNGVYYGHCRKANGTFIPCGRTDLKCGKLFCTGGSRMPTSGSLVAFDQCKGSFPSRAGEDHGMVASGTKCGEDMVCSMGQCVDLERAYRSTNCSAHCQNHAVCDHELQCQCEVGWAPPKCDNPTGNRHIIITTVAVLATLAVLAIIGALLWRYLFMMKIRNKSVHKNMNGSANPGFSRPEQKRRQHMNPVHVPQEVNPTSLRIPPPPPPQTSKPPVCATIPDEESQRKLVSYQNAKTPIVKPNIPPPPVPSAKPALSSFTGSSESEIKPVPSPAFKCKAAPPPPPQALKPPSNPKV
ncbi:zinc metalloproteinase-disintegrin-like ohanin [Sphaerodactylus townsendi]|uniref:zinc metalloproteinase-disintegrin-like ohanin n=1 Tax=Sphaerodactylus townsendi TaxID=933632 RepID=UPI00202704D4|nr:zinc metalloproteinase-disintegrin-like ohanin [Sphaerodactylus townsendi]